MTETTIFISYAWNGDDHLRFVSALADRLQREPGLTVSFDQYDVVGGDELTHYMEMSMRCDRVVHVCEPTYKEKADARRRGVGYEVRLGTADIFNESPERKYIPVLRGEDPSTSVPAFLAGIAYIDMRASRDFETAVTELLGAIRRQPARPRPAKNAAPTPSGEPQGLAPRRPTLFIGRDPDMAVLRGRILDESTPLTIIRGWPGIGKSTTIAALAHDPEILAAFPTVLWAFVGEHLDAARELRGWLRYLEPESAIDGASPAELSARLARVLASRRALLLIDDLWREEDAAWFRVGGARSHTILTTRGLELAHRLAAGASNVHVLPVLTPDRSLQLLEFIAPTVVARHRDASRLLVEELEGLPLAIRVAGHLLAAEEARGLSVETLLDELHEGRALLEAQAPDPGVADFVPSTVTALLRRTTDRLAPEERQRFAALGPLAPKPAAFSLRMLEKLWGVTDARPTVRALIDRGLLERSEEGTFQLHALLVRHANELLEEL